MSKVECTEKNLAYVFGPESSGDTPEERAKTSQRIWIRSQDQLVLYDKKVGAPGLVMGASEALEVFGWDVLYETIYRDWVCMVSEEGEPGKTFLAARSERKLEHYRVAFAARKLGWGLTTEEVQDAENNETRTSMKAICAICAVLDLDPRTVGFK